MRKIISLIIALAFIFSMAVPAMAAAPTAQEVAGNRLLSLSVIDGYPGGGLGLDKTITRAEVAVVLAKISGMGSAADLLKDTPSKFSDVKPNEWYTGWVNLASAQGWVKGDPQGTFRPNDPVQYREMVTMLLKALGYNDNLPGDWPTNYLAKAASLGITKDIVSDAKAHAVRGDVFIMTSRTLDKDTVSYDKDNDKFVVSGKSLLEDKMDFAKVEGVVTDIARVSSLKDNQIRIDGKIYKVVGPVDYEAIFGTEVKAWLNDDDEVVFVDIDSDSVYFDAVEWNSSKEELKLKDADVKYDLAKNAKVFLNGESAKASDLGNHNYAKVVLNDDGDVAFIDAYDFDFLVVEKVDGKDVLGYGDEIDAEDYAIVKDGKTIALADLAKGDILFYNRSAEFAEVFNKSVEGEISRIYTDRITVEGKDYSSKSFSKYINEKGDIANLGTGTKFEDAAEAMQDAGKVAVFLNRAGDMVFLSGDLSDLATSSSYAFVVEPSVAFQNRNKVNYSLDVMNAEGKVVKYDISKADVTGVDSILFNSADAKVNWCTSENLTTGALTGAAIAPYSVIELSFDKDGDIDKIQILGTKTVANSTKTTSKYIDGVKIDTDAIAFLAEDYQSNADDTDDIDVTTYSKLDFDYINNHSGGNPSVAYVKNDKVVAFVINGSDREDDSETYLTVATADQIKVSGKNIWTLKLVIDGKKATYDTKEGIATPSVTKGDFLKVKIDNKTGKVNSISESFELNQVVADGKVSDIKTADKSFKIGSTALKLGSDAVVVDATDSYKVISLSNLKNDDYAKAIRVSGGATPSSYVDVVVRTAKAGDTPVVTVPTDGTVTYIDPGFTYVIVDNQEIDIIGSAAEFFTRNAIQTGDKIAYELSAGNKMYKITAIDDDVTITGVYSPFADLTVNGDLKFASANNYVASNVKVTGKLDVDTGAGLAATSFDVKGATTLNTTGVVTFNSKLNGNVTVTAVGVASGFTNVTFGGNLAVNSANITVKNSTVGGNFSATAAVTFDGSVAITGTFTGASNVTLAPGATTATTNLVNDQKAADVAAGKLTSVTLAAGTNAGSVKLTNSSDVIVEYSVKGGAWDDLAASGASKDNIAVDAGDVIQVRVKTPVSAVKEITVKLADIKPVTMAGATFTDGSKDVTGLTSGVVYEVRITVGGAVGDWVTYTAADSKIVLDEAADKANTYEIRVKATDKQPASTIQSATGF